METKNNQPSSYSIINNSPNMNIAFQVCDGLWQAFKVWLC